jgi:hypothetical protein
MAGTPSRSFFVWAKASWSEGLRRAAPRRRRARRAVPSPASRRSPTDECGCRAGWHAPGRRAPVSRKRSTWRRAPPPLFQPGPEARLPEPPRAQTATGRPRARFDHELSSPRHAARKQQSPPFTHALSSRNVVEPRSAVPKRNARPRGWLQGCRGRRFSRGDRRWHSRAAAALGRLVAHDGEQSHEAAAALRAPAGGPWLGESHPRSVVDWRPLAGSRIDVRKPSDDRSELSSSARRRNAQRNAGRDDRYPRLTHVPATPAASARSRRRTSTKRRSTATHYVRGARLLTLC